MCPLYRDCVVYRAGLQLWDKEKKFSPLLRSKLWFLRSPALNLATTILTAVTQLQIIQLNSMDTLPFVAEQKCECNASGFLCAIGTERQPEIHSYERNWKFLA